MNVPPGLTPQVGDRVLIGQAILNLVRNAVESMRDTPAEQRLLNVAVATGSEGQVLSVTDRGCGIAADTLRRLFDPFFTTKSAGKGTGLGLWISYSIMGKMGGTITMNSKAGEGTTFVVQIPIVIPEKK